MPDFGRARVLGLVGSILVLLAIILSFMVGFLAFPLSLVGFILVLVSLNTLSDIYGERAIFRNALLSIIIGLIGFLLLFVILIILGLSMTAIVVRSELPREFEELPGAQALAQIIGLALISIMVFIVTTVISAYLWYRALNTLSLKSGEGLFRLAGLLYLGSALSLALGIITAVILVGIIIVLVGALLGLASWVILAIAFYELKTPQPPTQPPLPAVQV